MMTDKLFRGRAQMTAVLQNEQPWAVVQGDAVEMMRLLPDRSIDLILTDHAYESLEKHREIGTTTRLKKSEGSDNAWFPPFPDARLPEFMAECFRVLKDDRHFYMILDFTTTYLAKGLGEAAGFRYCNTIVWDKGATGMGWRWRERVQPILMWEKGSRQMRFRGWDNLIDAKRLMNPRTKRENGAPPEPPTYYPTQKPEGLNERLIQNSTDVGAQVVLDPFCGSSSCGKAAVRNGRRYIGIDLMDDAIMASMDALMSDLEEPVAPFEDAG